MRVGLQICQEARPCELMQLHAHAQAIHTQDSACSAQNTAFECIAVRVLRAPRRSAGLELWCVAKATTIVPCLAAPSPRPIGQANRMQNMRSAAETRGTVPVPAGTHAQAVRLDQVDRGAHLHFLGRLGGSTPRLVQRLILPLDAIRNLPHASVASGRRGAFDCCI